MIKNWLSFAKCNNYNSFNPTVGAGINFLTEKYYQGAKYGRLCFIRSALSSFIYTAKDFGNNRFVQRFFRGIFNLSPVFPMKSKISKWDPNIVLLFIENWWPLETLTLKELTFKLVFLLAMCSGQRVNTLSNINLDNIYFHEENCTIYFNVLLKSTRVNFQQEPLSFMPYENEKICVINVLKHYINRTRDIRKDSQLLISFRKPFLKISSDTISRWIKALLLLAGIDVHKNNIKSHSTRALSTSIASLSGMNISQIMAAAGWSCENTFTTFYKQSVKVNYGNSVLKECVT